MGKITSMSAPWVLRNFQLASDRNHACMHLVYSTKILKAWISSPCVWIFYSSLIAIACGIADLVGEFLSVSICYSRERKTESKIWECYRHPCSLKPSLLVLQANHGVSNPFYKLIKPHITLVFSYFRDCPKNLTSFLVRNLFLIPARNINTCCFSSRCVLLVKKVLSLHGIYHDFCIDSNYTSV